MKLNIDEMLRRETDLLVKDAQIMKANLFIKLANKEELRQEDWARFWVAIRTLNV